LKLYVPPDGRTSFEEGVESEVERLSAFQIQITITTM
jgi:hypothetical protein